MCQRPCCDDVRTRLASEKARLRDITRNETVTTNTLSNKFQPYQQNENRSSPLRQSLGRSTSQYVVEQRSSSKFSERSSPLRSNRQTDDKIRTEKREKSSISSAPTMTSYVGSHLYNKIQSEM